MTNPYVAPAEVGVIKNVIVDGIRFRIAAAIFCVSSITIACFGLPRFFLRPEHYFMQHWVFGFTPILLLLCVGLVSTYVEFAGSLRAKIALPILMLPVIPVIGYILYATSMDAFRTINGSFALSNFLRESVLPATYGLFLCYHFGAVLRRSISWLMRDRERRTTA